MDWIWGSADILHACRNTSHDPGNGFGILFDLFLVAATDHSAVNIYIDPTQVMSATKTPARPMGFSSKHRLRKGWILEREDHIQTFQHNLMIQHTINIQETNMAIVQAGLSLEQGLAMLFSISSLMALGSATLRLSWRCLAREGEEPTGRPGNRLHWSYSGRGSLKDKRMLNG